MLLSKDIADLKSMRQHEVFLGLKRDLAMVSLLLFFFLLLYLFIYSSLYTYIHIYIYIYTYIFFNCISLLFQAIQATFKAEEMVNYSYRKMKEEEGRRIAAVDAFHVIEKSIQELKAKLTEEEKERKSDAAADVNPVKECLLHFHVP